MFIFTYYIFISRIHFKLLVLPLLRKDSNIRKNYCCDKNLNFSRFRVTNFRIEICYLAMRTQYLHIHKQNMFGHFSSSICSHTRALVSILNSLFWPHLPNHLSDLTQIVTMTYIYDGTHLKKFHSNRCIFTRVIVMTDRQTHFFFLRFFGP